MKKQPCQQYLFPRRSQKQKDSDRGFHVTNRNLNSSAYSAPKLRTGQLDTNTWYDNALVKQRDEKMQNVDRLFYEIMSLSTALSTTLYSTKVESCLKKQTITQLH